MRCLLAENVPRRVKLVLEQHGQDVKLVTDHLAAGSPDLLVATTAVQMDCILVSHVRDMRRPERLVSQSQQDRFPTLSRIMLCCEERNAGDRLAMFLPIVEAKCIRVQALEDRRVLVEVGERRFRIFR